jgi:hypothetical protein
VVVGVAVGRIPPIKDWNYPSLDDRPILPTIVATHSQRHYPNAGKPWLASDVLFLEIAALRGMSLSRIAGFLGPKTARSGTRRGSWRRCAARPDRLSRSDIRIWLQIWAKSYGLAKPPNPRTQAATPGLSWTTLRLLTSHPRTQPCSRSRNRDGTPSPTTHAGAWTFQVQRRVHGSMT